MRILSRLVSALLAMAALAPATAHAAKGMEIATQDDATLLYHYYSNNQRAYRAAVGFKTTWIRTNLVWKNALPTQSNRTKRPKTVRYDWTPWDQLIDQAAQRGIRVEMTLTGPAPAWATANHNKRGRYYAGTYKPSPTEYAKFVSAAVRHFKGRVTRFSLWNEPNLVVWLSPYQGNGTWYRKLYTAGYKAARAASPSAKIFIAETGPYALKNRWKAPLEFMRQMLCVDKTYTKRNRRCGTLYADGYAHHAYDARHKPTHQLAGIDNVSIGTIGRLTRALDRFQALGALKPRKVARMPIYATEYGYFTRGLKATTPESKRARYLTGGFDIGLRNPRVKQMLQYSLIEAPDDTPWDYWNMWVVRLNGKKTGAYTALAKWATKQARARKIVVPHGPLQLRPAPAPTPTR